MRAAIRHRFAAAVGRLPAVFWMMWWGLIVNRLASFVIAFLSIYLVREAGPAPREGRADRRPLRGGLYHC